MKEQGFYPTDLHYAVLHALPDEGRKLGYHPLSVSVRHLTKELNDKLPVGVPQVTSAQVGTALRQLNLAKLTVPVKSGVVGAGTTGSAVIGWQRTPAGKKMQLGWKLEIEMEGTVDAD